MTPVQRGELAKFLGWEYGHCFPHGFHYLIPKKSHLVFRDFPIVRFRYVSEVEEFLNWLLRLWPPT